VWLESHGFAARRLRDDGNVPWLQATEALAAHGRVDELPDRRDLVAHARVLDDEVAARIVVEALHAVRIPERQEKADARR
jgi:hypothetical protein